MSFPGIYAITLFNIETGLEFLVLSLQLSIKLLGLLVFALSVNRLLALAIIAVFSFTWSSTLWDRSPASVTGCLFDVDHDITLLFSKVTLLLHDTRCKGECLPFTMRIVRAELHQVGIMHPSTIRAAYHSGLFCLILLWIHDDVRLPHAVREA